MSLLNVNLIESLEIDDFQEQASSENFDNKQIVNGVATCLPIITAVLNSGSDEIAEEVQCLLDLTKKLISDIELQLSANGIEMNAAERAHINALCVKTASVNFKQDQEVQNWAQPLIDLICCSHISAEINGVSLDTRVPAYIAHYSKAAINICSALHSQSGHFLETKTAIPKILAFLDSTSEHLLKDVQFREKGESEQLRKLLIEGASELFIVQFEKELKRYSDMIFELDSNEEVEFSLDQTLDQTAYELTSIFNSLKNLQKV